GGAGLAIPGRSRLRRGEEGKSEAKANEGIRGAIPTIPSRSLPCRDARPALTGPIPPLLPGGERAGVRVRRQDARLHVLPPPSPGERGEGRGDDPRNASCTVAGSRTGDEVGGTSGPSRTSRTVVTAGGDRALTRGPRRAEPGGEEMPALPAATRSMRDGGRSAPVRFDPRRAGHQRAVRITARGSVRQGVADACRPSPV